MGHEQLTGISLPLNHLLDPKRGHSSQSPASVTRLGCEFPSVSKIIGINYERMIICHHSENPREYSTGCIKISRILENNLSNHSIVGTCLNGTSLKRVICIGEVNSCGLLGIACCIVMPRANAVLLSVITRVREGRCQWGSRALPGSEDFGLNPFTFLLHGIGQLP